METMDESASEVKTGVYHWSIFEVEEHDPATELINIVAELNTIESTDLDPLYL